MDKGKWKAVRKECFARGVKAIAFLLVSSCMVSTCLTKDQVSIIDRDHDSNKAYVVQVDSLKIYDQYCKLSAKDRADPSIIKDLYARTIKEEARAQGYDYLSSFVLSQRFSQKEFHHSFAYAASSQIGFLKCSVVYVPPLDRAKEVYPLVASSFEGLVDRLSDAFSNEYYTQKLQNIWDHEYGHAKSFLPYNTPQEKLDSERNADVYVYNTDKNQNDFMMKKRADDRVMTAFLDKGYLHFTTPELDALMGKSEPMNLTAAEVEKIFTNLRAVTSQRHDFEWDLSKPPPVMMEWEKQANLAGASVGHIDLMQHMEDLSKCLREGLVTDQKEIKIGARAVQAYCNTLDIVGTHLKDSTLEKDKAYVNSIEAFKKMPSVAYSLELVKDKVVSLENTASRARMINHVQSLNL